MFNFQDGAALPDCQGAFLNMFKLLSRALEACASHEFLIDDVPF